MKRNRVKEFFGLRYIFNTRSKQIHRVDNLQDSCHFLNMKNGYYCSKKKALKLITQGDKEGNKYDGCRHCWKEMNSYGKNNICK